MKKMTRGTGLLALLLIAVAAVGPAFLFGCGCFYGTASAATIVPPQDCLDLAGYGHCAWLGLGGTNSCEETLTLLPVDDAEVFEVPPGESFELDDVVPYADMETDDAYCTTDVEVEADLGGTRLKIRFEVERINRGLRPPCD